MTLDALDRAILAHLQEDARQTSEALARKVALSPTAVQRRIKRLRRAGVIRAEVAVLSPAAVGRGLTAIVSVTLSQYRGEKNVVLAFYALDWTGG